MVEQEVEHWVGLDNEQLVSGAFGTSECERGQGLHVQRFL